MKKAFYYAALLSFLAFTGAQIGFAQTTVQTTMPPLYDQNGTEVNAGSSKLPAGNYYLGGGPSNGGHIVNYYGNGTYYDPSTMTYGGSVSDPSGTAGITFSYGSTGSSTSPGLPNTGAGGLATENWAVLVLSALAVAGGSAYLVKTLSVSYA